MNKAVNNSTLTKLGDIYHYMIALKDCFELEDDDKLQIEVSGDISVISKANRGYQKEVKHHLGSSMLSDRDIDFWKTLANWYVEYDRIKIFKQLILFTTAMIKPNSIWANWTSYNVNEKLKALLGIGLITKPREEGFRKQYIRIFNNYDNDILNDVLSKTMFCHTNPCISGIAGDFARYLGHIPQENRDQYIGALLGQILAKVKDVPFKWEVTRQDFERILQKTAPAFIQPGQRPLPMEYADRKISVDFVNKLFGKKFVEAIRSIEHDVMIQRAISDYWKSDMTILRYFQDDPLYLNDLDRYKADLFERLFYTKNTTNCEATGMDRELCINLSKRFYNTTMQWDANDFGSIIRNQGFFQRGIIHNIIDDGEIDWRVGENRSES
jgi:hypothetical protein